MKKGALALSFVFYSLATFSQLTPWNAKVILGNPGTNETDTVWIGCDQDGAWGYQVGLDVIDTFLEGPVSIWTDDSLITDGCFNLKKDIKNFLKGIVYFDFQLIDVNPFTFPFYPYIRIDTNEFKFDNGAFEITSVYIKVLQGGYINSADAIDTYIFDGRDTLDDPDPFYFDSLSVLYAFDLYNICLPLNYDTSQMRLRLEVGFNLYLPTALQDHPKLLPSIFPNPTSDIIFVTESDYNTGYEIRDLPGRIIKRGIIEQIERNPIDLSEFQAGIYVFNLFDRITEQIVYSERILIQ